MYSKADNHGDLYSSIDLLEQLSGVLDVQVIEAEVQRSIGQYVLVRMVLDGGRKIGRLILVAAEVVRPCPHDAIMLAESVKAEKDGENAFFTQAEILQRRKGKPLDVADWKEPKEEEEDKSTILDQ